MSIEVLSSGPLLSVQDLGWRGLAHLGLAQNGSLDRAATRLVNALVGNDEAAAVLEITWGGAGLRFQEAHWIAVGGADLRAELDGQPLQLWSAHRVRAGSVLRFATPRRGACGYLAVAGGLDLPSVLGSRATEMRSAFGGLHGRALQRGDVLPVAQRAGPPPATGYWLATHWLYPLRPLRLLPGAQFAELSAESRQQLFDRPYVVSARSDRMGLRLKATLSLSRPVEKLSEALVAGTVQLPPDGQPIVLTRAHQSTGGYPAIAHIASVDLDRLAQLRPGVALSFEQIDLPRALQLLQKREQALSELLARIRARQLAPLP